MTTTPQETYFEEPQTGRIDRFTDGELLRELWRRKRMVELHATEYVSDHAVHTYRNEQGFWQGVKRSLFRNLGAAMEERADDLSHVSVSHTVRHMHTEYKRSIWVITKPTGGRIE